jgi:hypothetical protein
MAGSAPTDWTSFEVNGNPAVILVNGIEIKYWDGTTFADLGGNPPKGKYITNDVSRVFIAKDDYIYFCAFQDAQDWSSAENSGFVQYYTANGGPITALKAFKDVKYIWKKDSFAGIYGVSYYDFRIMNISDSIGCVNYKTVQEVNGVLIWLAQQGIYAFTQGNPVEIGDKVSGFFNRINWSAINTACAFSDGLRYYLNLPLDSSATPNIRLVYDTRYGKWRVCAYDEGFQAGTIFNRQIYAMNTTGRVYAVNSGTTDDGAVIPWSLTSKAFDEGISEAEKEYKEIHFQGDFSQTQSMSIAISTEDRGTSFTTLSYDPLAFGTTAQNKNVIIPLDTTPLTNWMRYRLSGTGPATFYRVQRYFRVCRVQH